MTTELPDSPLSLLAGRPIAPEDAPAQSGVYMVINLRTGHCYFGESGNVRLRLKRHRYHLRLGCHANKALQASWNDYSESDFAFCTLSSYGKSQPDFLRVGAQNVYITKYLDTFALNCSNADECARRNHARTRMAAQAD